MLTWELQMYACTWTCNYSPLAIFRGSGKTVSMNTYWRQISNNLQNKVNSGTYKVWIAPLQAELLLAPLQTELLLADCLSEPQSATGPALVTAESGPAGVLGTIESAALGATLSTGKRSCARLAPTAHQKAISEKASLQMVALQKTAQQTTVLQKTPKDAQTSLCLVAPNEFVASWVRERLSGIIQIAAEEVLQRTVTLSIRAAVQAESFARQDSALLDTKTPAAALTPASQPACPTEPEQQASRLSPLPAPQTRTVAEQMYLPVRLAKTDFNWRYGFDGFVVGPCNDMAYAAARNMLPDHGAVDTLFLSSGPGLGKTHLTQAVGHALCQSANRRPKVEYLSAESFSSAFVQAMKARDIDAFKARFRDVDVLLLEDVHFLQGKEKMQVEVLSTVKALQERGSRVVLTSSFAPRELGNLDPTLVSRFCSGFLAGMEKPDFPTRRRILQDKAVKTQANLSDDVCDLMAERLTGDVRQLEGCLSNLILRARLQGRDLSLDMAAEILAQYVQDSPFMDLDAITRRVCEGFGLAPEQIVCRSRRNAHVTARNTVFYLARKHTDLSLQDIGEHFNRRHSTVLKGIAAVDRELTRETPLGRQIASTLNIIENRVKGRSGSGKSY